MKEVNSKPEHTPFILDILMIRLPLPLTTVSGGCQGFMSIQEKQGQVWVTPFLGEGRHMVEFKLNVC
jgi:hypothetical protein